jgi:hypothetical protein
MSRLRSPRLARLLVARLLVALVAPAVAGCLGEPTVDERLTHLEILDASPVAADAFTVGGATPVEMTVRVTYREILTGHVIAELRASETLTSDDTRFDLEAAWVAKSEDVDRILDESVSLGFAAVPATGWDHLVQELALSFDAGTPPPDASGVAPTVGAPTGLFLLLYFSTDVEEVELENGDEIEVVHPLYSRDHPILYSGVEIVAAPADAGGAS